MSTVTDSDFQGDKDQAKHRVIEIKDGGDKVVNKVHVERRDPFGFIHAWLDKGKFPGGSPLNGAFTSFELAAREVEKYVLERNAVVSEIRQRTVEPAKDVK